MVSIRMAAPNLNWVAVSPLLGGANSNNVAIGLEVAPIAGPAVGCGQLDFGFCRRSEIDVTNSERVGSQFLSLRQFFQAQFSPHAFLRLEIGNNPGLSK